ncbi:MAG: hypothetical protein WA902_07730 [Thermosynechococcaceae cyanobacterium]
MSVPGSKLGYGNIPALWMQEQSRVNGDGRDAIAHLGVTTLAP